MSEVKKFIHGRELSEKFYKQRVVPIIKKKMRNLRFTAAFLGYGSDVLGYDDEVSTDHMWGPRLYLFIREVDMNHKDYIDSCFRQLLPYEFMGYCVNFSKPNPMDNGVRVPERKRTGGVSSLIVVDTIEHYLESYLGKSDFENLSYTDWLSFSEHKLLSIVNGKIFYEMLGLEKKIEQIKFYPNEVRNYLIASNWSLISMEQAFMKRNIMTRDKLGSILVGSRLTERLMRLCFLYSGVYAPYSKWFTKSFMELNLPDAVFANIEKITLGKTNGDREEALVNSLVAVAEIHNKSGITEYIAPMVSNYHTRDIKVIFAERYADAVRETYKDSPLYNVR